MPPGGAYGGAWYEPDETSTDAIDVAARAAAAAHAAADPGAPGAAATDEPDPVAAEAAADEPDPVAAEAAADEPDPVAVDAAAAEEPAEATGEPWPGAAEREPDATTPPVVDAAAAEEPAAAPGGPWPGPAEPEQAILDALGPERTLEDRIREWYRSVMPWAKIPDDRPLQPEFIEWATQQMQKDGRIKPVHAGWAIAAMAIATHKTLTAAATACGMNERTLRRLIAEKPQFAEIVEAAQQELIKGIAADHAAVRAKAIARLETCLDSKDERVAMRAAQLLANGVGLL
jgi:hypothetical protein